MAHSQAQPSETARLPPRSWNDTDAPCEPTLLSSLIEAQSDRSPDRVAVEFEQAELSYGDLEAAANRLAHHLAALGSGPGELVGICLERSPSLVIAVLAVLKSGAAYVPLDPAYPRERLASMLLDARPGVVVTETGVAGILPVHPGTTVVLEAQQPQIAVCPSTRPPARIGPEAAAYVIYTSGSSGEPKGVVVPHAGLANLVDVVTREFDIRPGTRVLQFANFSFDAWVAELAMTLPVGGTLVLAPRAVLANPDTLHELLRRTRIEVVTLPPAVLSVLDPMGLSALRTVCSAGETCSWEIVERWSTPERRFLNGYGPTECTVAVTYYRTSPDHRPADSTSVPIGAPHANKRAYVVDENLSPVPVGAPGELLVGGVGIALGYLRRDELTAERFLADPFSGDASARAYRTGDLVRWLADGVLEFLGRIDDQVKLRGFRIELGEIDAALGDHPGVHAVTTLLREDTPGDRRLVSYVVGDVREAELRSHLRHRLPEWMVPSAIVALDSLPLTPNGKVDRRALPEPAIDRPPHVAPETPLEKLICDIFANVLRLERAGLDDSFFALGGDSLLATRAAATIADEATVAVPVAVMFEAPTPRELAPAILVGGARENEREPILTRLAALSGSKRALLEARLLTRARRASAERIPRRGPGDPTPLSFAQQRLWFLDQLHPGEHTYNAALPMLVHGSADADAIQRALDAVVERHEVMRTIYPLGHDGDISQRVLPGAHVELTRLDLRSLPDDEQLPKAMTALRAIASRAFDLAREVTTRAALLRLSGDRHVLMIVSHHICCDGWSRDVLFRDLAAFYDAFTTGAPVTLEELPIQYADYALWQRRWLQGDELERQLGYWRRALSGAPPTLDMPTDKPRPKIQSSRGAFRWFSVGAGVTEELVRIGRQERATLYQTLLAAYQALVYAHSGQDDFLIGSPIANRQRREVESLVGLFSNTIVVRAQVGGDPTFRELIGRVRQATVGGYAQQDLPFEKLVEALRPPRDPSRNPLFQTNFRVQSVSPPRLSLCGAPVEALELDLRIARFDFAMDLHVTDDGSLRGYFEYNTDLFEDAWAQAMTSDYLAVLDDFVREPDTVLSALPSRARTTPALT